MRLERKTRRALWRTSLLVLEFVACSNEKPGAPPAELTTAEMSGGMALVCTQSNFESLNTFVSPDLGAADIRLLLFTPLVLYGAGGEYKPYLATSWEWGDGQRTLNFEIRPGLLWHDGAPVTASDVAWTIEAASNPDYAYPSGDDLASLEDVIVRDSLTLELRFTEPFVVDLEPFVWLPILPRHLLAEIPPSEFAQAEYHRAPVGSGPFKFRERRPDGWLVFDRFDEFPEELGRPYLDRIAIRTIEEPSAIRVELETQSVDVCVTSPGLAELAEASGRLKVNKLEPASTQVVPLNTRNAYLSDVRVRRALSAALRRSDIAAAMSPAARPARNPLPESSPWFDAQALQPDGNPALAASLLEEAGWQVVDGVRRNSQGQPLRLSLVAPSGLENGLTVAQAQWRSVGVDVELRFMEWTSYVPLLMNPEERPDIMALSFAPEKIYSPGSELYSEFHTDGFSNLASYSAPDLDALLERLGGPLSPEDRGATIREIQRRVAEDVPMLFTVYMPRLAISGPRLEGFAADLNGPFTSVMQWWIPPERRR